MKRIYKISLLGIALVLILSTKANCQAALTMRNTSFDESGFNTAYIAQNEDPVTLTLTNTLGGGIQDMGQINFLGYTTLSEAKLSVGARINSKYYGLFRTSTVEVIAAKNVAISSSSTISAGFGMGLEFTSIRSGELNSYVDRRDPMLVDDVFPQYRYIFGFGIAYTWRNKLKAGISMPTLVRTESEFYPLYVSNVSYKMGMGEDFGIEPQLLLFGSDIAPISAEINVKVDYRKQFWIQIGGRTTRAFTGALGVNTSFIAVGYAYNAYFQKYRSIVPATHSINLTFRIPGDKATANRQFQLW